jgi:hypothetical protein
VAVLKSDQFGLARIAPLHQRRDVTFHAALGNAQILDFGEQLMRSSEFVLASISAELTQRAQTIAQRVGRSLEQQGSMEQDADTSCSPRMRRTRIP